MFHFFLFSLNILLIKDTNMNNTCTSIRKLSDYILIAKYLPQACQEVKCN